VHRVTPTPVATSLQHREESVRAVRRHWRTLTGQSVRVDGGL